MIVYIFSSQIDIFKISLKSSHNIESVLFSAIFLLHKSAIFNAFDLACFLSGHASNQESHVIVQTQH